MLSAVPIFGPENCLTLLLVRGFALMEGVFPIVVFSFSSPSPTSLAAINFAKVSISWPLRNVTDRVEDWLGAKLESAGCDLCSLSPSMAFAVNIACDVRPARHCDYL